MAASVPALPPVPAADTALVILDDLLLALAHPPPLLQLLSPSPWADWIADERGKAACRRNLLPDQAEPPRSI